MISDMNPSGDYSNITFVQRHPPPLLSHYIESLWYWRSDVRQDGRDRIMPDGTAGMIINLHEDETRLYNADGTAVIQRLDGAGFDGAMSRPFVIDTAEQIHVLGVNFLPGGAWPFMAHAQDELLNQHLSLRDIWGTEAASLREQLIEAPGPVQRLQILEQILLSRLCRPLQRHPAVSQALTAIQQDPGGVRIQQILQPGTLSCRRLSRLFELETGMTPKRFARLMRFRRVLTQLQQSTGLTPVDWTELALQQGYHDQPHFIRDFREFSGCTPATFLRQMGTYINHLNIA